MEKENICVREVSALEGKKQKDLQEIVLSQLMNLNHCPLKLAIG